MPLGPACLWILGVALGIPVPGDCCGTAPHSLRYSYLRLPEPSQGLPQSFIRGYLDDQPIVHYDSLTRKMEPLVPWMKKVEENNIFSILEWVIGTDLEELSRLDHQTGEAHTWHATVVCEDGNINTFFCYGYDGIDFLSFKKENVRWVAAEPQAQKLKEKWERDISWSQRRLFYQENCISWLHQYLPYKKNVPEKTKTPVGKVTSKVTDDGLEVLICQTYGFYPKEIQATWTRDGENWEQGTIRRNVAPNSDGTYYVWISTEIEPKERDRYRCRLEHDGLQEPLVLPFKEEMAGIWWKIPVGIGVALISGAAILLFTYKCWSRRRICYQEVRTSLGDLPLVNVSVSSASATEDEIQPESSSQSEDRASYKPLWPQRVLEVPESNVRRREGSNRSLGGLILEDLEALEEAGGTQSRLAQGSWPTPKERDFKCVF